VCPLEVWVELGESMPHAVLLERHGLWTLVVPYLVGLGRGLVDVVSEVDEKGSARRPAWAGGAVK
jgi:hypothetical protein